MKSNKYLTIGLLTGFIVGGCIGVLAWAFLQKSFCYFYLCRYRECLIGIVIGTLIDYEKKIIIREIEKMHNALKGKQEFIVLSIIGPT